MATSAAPRAAGAPASTQTVLVAGSAAPPVDSERSGSGPWAWLAAGLGLLVIVASGILLFLLFSGIGEEAATPSPSLSPTIAMVKTPDFIDKKEENAASMAERHGLKLEIDYFETGEFEADRVIEQLPEPGIEIPVGSSVQLTVTTQVETVVVPDIHGFNEFVALEQLTVSGLRAGVRFVAADRAARGLCHPDGSSRRGLDRARLLRGLRGLERTDFRRHGHAVPSDADTGSDPTTAVKPGAITVPFTGGGARLQVPVSRPRNGAHPARRSRVAGRGHLPGPPPSAGWIVHDQKPQPGEIVPIGSKVDLVLMDPGEPCTG